MASGRDGAVRAGWRSRGTGRGRTSPRGCRRAAHDTYAQAYRFHLESIDTVSDASFHRLHSRGLPRSGRGPRDLGCRSPAPLQRLRHGVRHQASQTKLLVQLEPQGSTERGRCACAAAPLGPCAATRWWPPRRRVAATSLARWCACSVLCAASSTLPSWMRSGEHATRAWATQGVAPPPPPPARLRCSSAPAWTMHPPGMRPAQAAPGRARSRAAAAAPCSAGL